MAPVSDVEGERGRGRSGQQPLSREDCLCPVCLEIYMEPVTLPCTHTFCKACFLESVDKATLCCPMCRRRVSTWARLNSRNKTLVNEPLWGQIQTAFPLQCQRRLSGLDADSDAGVSLFFHKVSEPGELRQEFEDQITKLTEEKRVQDEEQKRASEEYIQKLLAEEEEELQEERRRREEDERLARLISQQLNSVPVSQENLRPDDAAAKKKEKTTAGQIDRYLCPVQSKSSDSSSSSSTSSNKENILLSQVKLPSEHRPPTLDYYGPQTHHQDRQTDQSEPLILPLPSVELRGGGTLKRKMEDEGGVTSKRDCPSSSTSSCAVADGIAALEAELQSRRRQEDEDRRVALMLQKELDQEERQRATDRSKGSADAYQLRQARTTPKTTPTAARKTARTSTFTRSSSVQGSTSGSSSRGRQTTLTDMFTFSS